MVGPKWGTRNGVELQFKVNISDIVVLLFPHWHCHICWYQRYGWSWPTLWYICFVHSLSCYKKSVNKYLKSTC